MNDPRPSGRGEALLVFCLCAAWCYVCDDFRAMLASLARAHGNAEFVWVDIEDDSELVGEVEVEDFPTLAVFRGDKPVFFGVTRASAPAISRLLSGLLATERLPVAVPAPVAALPRTLAGRAREKPA